MRTIQRIRYYCHFAKPTGYSRAAHDYLLALARYADFEIQISQLGAPGGELEPRYRLLLPLLGELADPDVAIYHAPPASLALLAPTLAERDQRAKKVAITTWETSTLPEHLAGALAEFDLVIVPSAFCRDAMDYRSTIRRTSPSGSLHDKIAIVPHGFDPDWWWGVGETQPQPPPAHDHRYRFYSIGAWCERKNHLGLIAAYFHAFTRDDPVSLMVVSAGADMNAIRSLIARTGIDPAQLPELHVPGEPLTENQLRGLHAEADCFVSATRAEGFGLPHFEAGFMGKTVASPLYGGHSDFLMTAPNAYGTSFQLTPCFGSELRGRIVEEGGQLVQESKVAIPPGLDCKQCWAEPDLVDLARAMECAVDTRNPSPMAEVAAAYREYDYESVAYQLQNALEDM